MLLELELLPCFLFFFFLFFFFASSPELELLLELLLFPWFLWAGISV